MTYFPPGALARMFSVTNYGATGDGANGVDDTAAIIACIQAAVAVSGPLSSGIIYLPKPSSYYLVSDSLELRLLSDLGNVNDGWRRNCFMWGETPDTTIRLAPNSSGYGSASTRKAVIKTGSESSLKSNPEGVGSQAFGHYIRNLTVSIGSGNPGAMAFSFLASNRGAMLDCTAIDEANTAQYGIDCTTGLPGPALVKRCKVVGFNKGFAINDGDYHMTIEDCEFTNQRQHVIWQNSERCPMAIRGIKSYNKVPVLRLNSLSTCSITESDFYALDDTVGTNALEIFGNVTVTRCRNYSAYTNTIVNTQGTRVDTITDREIYDYSSVSPQYCFQGRSVGYLGLSPKDTPEFESSDPNDFANVEDYGATRSSSNDASSAIQAALNSGKPIIYLPRGTYYCGSAMSVPASVQKICGYTATLGRYQNYPGTLFTTEASDIPLIVEHLSFAVFGFSDTEEVGVLVSNRPVALKYCETGKFTDTQDSLMLDVWTEDTIGPVIMTSPKRCWLRQCNPEYEYIQPSLQFRGGTAWIHGFKTEGNSTVIDASNTDIECFASAFYPLTAGTRPLIKLRNCANVHIQYKTSGQQYYRTLIQERQKNDVRSIIATGTTSGIYSSRYTQ